MIVAAVLDGASTVNGQWVGCKNAVAIVTVLLVTLEHWAIKDRRKS